MSEHVQALLKNVHDVIQAKFYGCGSPLPLAAKDCTVLDDHHEFKTGMPIPVCSNTANLLSQTRFKDHFKINGAFSTRYGVLDCAPSVSTTTNTGACC